MNNNLRGVVLLMTFSKVEYSLRLSVLRSTAFLLIFLEAMIPIFNSEFGFEL